MATFGVLGPGDVGQVLAKGLKDHDTTNPTTEDPPEQGVLRSFAGPNESLMERLQRAYPAGHFVKVFDSVGSARMVDPDFQGVRPTMFYCDNDAGAKATVARVPWPA